MVPDTVQPGILRALNVRGQRIPNHDGPFLLETGNVGEDILKIQRVRLGRAHSLGYEIVFDVAAYSGMTDAGCWPCPRSHW